MIKHLNRCRTLKTESLHEANPAVRRRHHRLSIRTAHDAASDDNAGSMENPGYEWWNILR